MVLEPFIRREYQLEDDKAGFWKCPYHNGRMCMEMMDRFVENNGNRIIYWKKLNTYLHNVKLK